MQAKLVVVEGRAGRREVVLTLPASIGRKAHQTLQILHPTVSREHCELVEEDGQILVRDKQSANGTWISGKRVTESLLKPGDRLTVGPLVFEADYIPGNGAAPAGAPSAKKKGVPPAKKSAGAVQPAPATAADDFEAALAADLMAELGGVASDEVEASAAAPTLDGEPLPAGEFDHLADELGAPQDDLDVELLGGLEAEAIEPDLALPELEADELADVDFKDLKVDSAELSFEPVAEVESLELDEPVASDLDLELDFTSAEPDFSEPVADALSTGVEPSLDDLVASDEPSAPWDAIGDEVSADLSLDDDDNDLDLALGDLGLEAVELDSLAADSAEPTTPDAIEIDSASAGALDLDELNLESPEIDGLELELSDSPDAISDDLALDAELELPLGDDLSSEVPAAEASAAPPASLDDFFAELNGGDSGAADEMPAIELDDLSLGPGPSEIEFESAEAGPEIAAIDFGAEPAGADPASPLELGDELNLDVDLEFDDLKLDDSEVAADGSGVEVIELFGAPPPGEEASLRIADVDLDNLDLESELSVDDVSEELALDDVVAPTLAPQEGADELVFNLDSDDSEVALNAPAEELHLFLEDEPAEGLPEEAIALDDALEPALDGALEEPSAELATDHPLDVLTDADPLEPSSSDEAAQQGTIFAHESEIVADGDSQDLWPVDEAVASTDAFALDAISPDGDFAGSPDSDIQSASDELISPEWEFADEAPLETLALDVDLPPASEVTAVEPADTWSEAPADIPAAPDNVDPFDFLSMEDTSAGAAEIVEPFVDDEDTPYDPDSPRQRMQSLAPEIAPPNSEEALLDEGLTAQTIDSEAPDAPSALSEGAADDIFFVDGPVADAAPELDLALPRDDSPAEPVVEATFASAPPADEVAQPEAEFSLDDDLLAFDEVEPAQAVEPVQALEQVHPVDEPIAELPGFDESSSSPAELAAEDNLDDLFAELDATEPVVDEPLSFDELDVANDEFLTDNLPADEPLAGELPVDDLLADDRLADELLADDFLASPDASQSADETLDVNADSLLTFNETSVEELALLDAGDDAPALLSAPQDETSPLAEPAPLDDEFALGELDLGEPSTGELAIGEPELGDLGLGDSELGELDLGEPNLDSSLDSSPGMSSGSDFPAPPAAVEESAAFDFLDAPSAASAAPAQEERIWWPFGDKSAANSNAPAGSPPAMPTVHGAATDELASFAAPASHVEDEPPLELGPGPATDELTFEDAPLGGAMADDLALDDLTFEDAAPAEINQSDLSLDNLSSDEPLALGEPPALADDAIAVPDIDDNLSSPPQSDATIAFLDEDEPALLLDGPTSDESTAEMPLAMEDDLGLSNPALDSLDLSTPSPGPSVADNLPAAAASAPAAAPARKWWKFWDKSGKPSAKAPKPAKPVKGAKKSKSAAENQDISGLPITSGTSSTSTPSPAADDLLLLGGAGAAAEELLLPDGPELDFAPLSLDDGPEPSSFAPAPVADEENFRTLYAEVVEETSPAVDEIDDLVFDAPEEEAASEPDFPDVAIESLESDQAAEPDFAAFDADDPFGEEFSADASATNTSVDEFASESPSASADEPEPQLPGEAETVDDSRLDDFFKNF